MRLKILYNILIFVLIVGCVKENEPTSPIENEEDRSLKEKILGGWKFSTNLIYFYNDGTFIDSSFAFPYPWFEGDLDSLNVCTETKKDGSFLNIAAIGKYKIENGILKKQPLSYFIDCNPLKAPAAYLYFDNHIEIIGDTLKLTTYYIWQKSNQSNDNIWGSWVRDYWAWSYHDDLPNKTAPLLITDSIIFYPDSSNYHRKVMGFPYSGKTYSRPFNYTPPLLYIISDYTFYDVSFKNNEMHWYQRNRTTKYLRIK